MPELTDVAKIQSDGNPHQPLTAENFNAAGDIKGTKPEILSADLALVVGTAQAARDFLLNKQWNLDHLYGKGSYAKVFKQRALNAALDHPEMSVQEAVKAEQAVSTGYCDPFEDAGIY